MAINKQDSNLSAFRIAEEESLGVLPASPHWYRYEANDYPNFGEDITKVSRETINPTRKVLKGGITDVDAVGGLNHDMVMADLQRLFRGFFFTNGVEQETTRHMDASLPTEAVATDVDGGTNLITWSTDQTQFTTGMLVATRDFGNSENNGLATVDSSLANQVILTGLGLVDEVSPPAIARMSKCGFQFLTGDLVAQDPAGALTLTLTSSVQDLTAMGLSEGDTVFLGGDADVNQFGDSTTPVNRGYGRVRVLQPNVMVLVECTFVPAVGDGVGKDIQMFFGNSFRDEPDAANIVRRSYHAERTLGNDGSGEQAEYIPGMIANQLTVNLPLTDKITTELGYVGLRGEDTTGAEGLRSNTGTKHEPLPEEFVNSTSDLFVARLVAVDSQANLVGYIDNMTMVVNNNVSPNKALGAYGAFDFTTGDFQTTGNIEVYFDTVAAKRSIRANEDVALQLVAANGNEGQAWSMPLLTLGGGQAEVERNEAIKMSLDKMASVGPSGVTLVHNYFPYLPDAAMPNIVS